MKLGKAKFCVLLDGTFKQFFFICLDLVIFWFSLNRPPVLGHLASKKDTSFPPSSYQ